MATMLDYLDWRGDLRFAADPFNDVDNQLCAQISFIGFQDIVSSEPGEEVDLPQAAAAFFDRNDGRDLSLGAIIPSAILEMTKKMAASPRFGQTKLTAYRSVKSEGASGDEQLQWTALTLVFEDGSLYISFSGTDDTIISWKEDMNLAVMREIPSQRAAAEYVAEVIREYPGYGVRIGGHSKGGNLAVYAGAKCPEELQKRVLCVYDNDGPGFHPDFLQDEGYLRIKSRVRNIVPEESFVGLLLAHDLPQIVVKSTNRSLLQHDSFSWLVEQNRFVQAQELSKDALRMEKTLKNWLHSMSPEQTADFVEILYRILTCTDASTLTELVGNRRSFLPSFFRLAPEDRAVVKRTIRSLLGAGRDVYRQKDDGETPESDAAPAKPKETKEKKKDFVTRLSGASLYVRKKK